MKRGFRTQMWRIVALCACIPLLLQLAGGTAFANEGGQLSLNEQLGKRLFNDNRLSDPEGMACAACHGMGVGFTGPDSQINAGGAVYEGAVPGRFGNRKPPAAAYAGGSPILALNGSTFSGGMFWDGRATGLTLGDPLAEQAQGPFLNPLEHNNASAEAVVEKVKTSTYAPLFKQVWGPQAFDDTALAYERIARSIASYERSGEVNPFSSRYDTYLNTGRGLNGQERHGLALFEGKARCAGCHTSQPVNGAPPVFTDYTYSNLGIPKNPMNPYYGEPQWGGGPNWIDSGLGGFLAGTSTWSTYADANMGKFKVPTLRNVDKRPYPSFVKAYGHNGYFKSLKEIVHFYNTRDTLPWPAPEVAENMDTAQMGNLGLSNGEENAIVAFLKTLTDE